jgi:hypothetical protein
MRIQTIKQAASALILIATLAMLSDTTALTPEQRAFEGLITSAESVVAVEILSTDYTATPSDGPMVATAKVLKSAKGGLTAGKTFAFAETAWVGPTYQKGDLRILFLEKPRPTESQKSAEWRILSNLYARTDFFIEKDSVPALTSESLQSFLKKIQELEPKPKKVVFTR